MERTVSIGDGTATRRRAANAESDADRRCRLASLSIRTRDRLTECEADLSHKRAELASLEAAIDRVEILRCTLVERHQDAESAYRADVDDAKRHKALAAAIRDVAQPRLRLGDLLP
jgi:multidrug resistance efflux pump